MLMGRLRVVSVLIAATIASAGLVAGPPSARAADSSTPGAVENPQSASSMGATLFWWSPPAQSGDASVSSYEVERSVDGGAWSPEASVPADPKPSYVDHDARINHGYLYRARAVTAAAMTGPWVEAPYPVYPQANGYLMSGRVSGTGPLALFLVQPYSDAPLIPVSNDPSHSYREPDGSETSKDVVVSRSTGVEARSATTSGSATSGIPPCVS